MGVSPAGVGVGVSAAGVAVGSSEGWTVGVAEGVTEGDTEGDGVTDGSSEGTGVGDANSLDPPALGGYKAPLNLCYLSLIWASVHMNHTPGWSL